jgi:hypothetical protein
MSGGLRRNKEVRNLSQAVLNALGAGEMRPVWLLQLDLVSDGASTTLRFSDRPFTLWGEQWIPAVFNWGMVDRYFDPALGDLRVSSATITISNEKDILGPGAPGISHSLRMYDLGRSRATIYLWLDGAGLAPPSGQSQNDLLTILEGTPEIATGVTPRACPLDIVSKTDEISVNDLSLGEVLSGRYTRNQWPSLQQDLVDAWKPAVFGTDIVVPGLPLSRPERTGRITGPSALFDPATGANHVLISFDKRQDSPYPTPCDIYVGDYRLTARDKPVKTGASEWKYKIYSPSGSANYFIPEPMNGGEPFFAPSAGALWPRSDESKAGPYASSEPPMGAPYQFYHGLSDTGNAADGLHRGLPGRFIKEVYVNGVKTSGQDALLDDAFGVAWLRMNSSSVRTKVGSPPVARLKYTKVDNSFTTGAAQLRPQQLTAQWPHGYNAGTNPCILGDFSVPASGGGAPSSAQLGLINSLNYPAIGSRIAAVRFVMRYTGLDVSTGTFNLSLFGANYSFSASELGDGAQIKANGWWVTQDKKGPQFEIWPNNNGYPYTQTSPNPRHWDIFELSRDVTAEALAHIKSHGGFADSFRAWFSGSQWPGSTNSLVALAVELEVAYDSVESALEGPSVTALIGGPSAKAGDIIREFIPTQLAGSGFDDPTLPSLKYRVDVQTKAASFIRTVAKEAGRLLKKNGATGKWDLISSSAAKNNLNPPSPTGGLADITQAAMLADATGAPMIMRVRPAPERVVNEVSVRFTSLSGAADSVTARDLRSIGIYGVKNMTVSLAAVTTRDVARAYAQDIINASAEVADFYRFTFPLGSTLALEPGDILQVTADMDSLAASKMMVVSASLDMGDIAGGNVATVTVNARRYSRAIKGYGITQYGLATYGLGQIMEN